MANPILVTGAAGRVGAVGRTVYSYFSLSLEPLPQSLLRY